VFIGSPELPKNAAYAVRAIMLELEARGDQAYLSESAPPATDLTGPLPNALRRDKRVWTITYNGVQMPVPQRKGLQYIALALTAPGRLLEWVELHALVHEVEMDLSDSGVVMTLEAKLDAKARIDEITVQLEKEADSGVRDALIAERDNIKKQVLAAHNKRGRPRRLGSRPLRAQKAICKDIDEAIKVIREVHAEAATHLERSMNTKGGGLSYEPSSPTEWLT